MYQFVFINSFLTPIFGCQKEDPVELPTLNTIEVTEITAITAKSGGNIADDGSPTVTARGIVWSRLCQR
jgi:hypothetical protein